MNAPSRTWHWSGRIPVKVLVAALLVGSLVPTGSAQSPSPLTLQPETGRVGIGTATPGSKLHVTGQTRISGTAPARLTLEPEGGSTNLWNLDNQAGTFRLFREDYAASGTGGNPQVRMVLQNNGNVGIGTTSPITKFQVSGGRASVRANNEEWALGLAYNDSQYPTDTFFLGVTSNGGSSGTGMFQISNAAGASRVRVLNNGDMHIGGTLYATVKYFQIPHPLDPGKLLTHASLEGPEAGVYYRGETQLVNGEAVVTLPPYFEALTRKEGRTVQLTPITGWAPLYVTDGVQGGGFTVRTDDSKKATQRFFWEVKAVRADIAPVPVETARPLAVSPSGPGP
jgi:hypothetical protein